VSRRTGIPDHLRLTINIRRIIFIAASSGQHSQRRIVALKRRPMDFVLPLYKQLFCGRSVSLLLRTSTSCAILCAFRQLVAHWHAALPECQSSKCHTRTSSRTSKVKAAESWFSSLAWEEGILASTKATTGHDRQRSPGAPADHASSSASGEITPRNSPRCAPDWKSCCTREMID